ncbi:CGNR zinc finger domain-containing protein [Cellulomonas sp. P5_C5]
MPDQLLRWVELGSEPGVAPGALERVRALLNTDDRFHGVDRLAGGPDGLVTFRDVLRRYLESGDAAELDVLAAARPLVVAFGGGAATLRAAGPDDGVTGLLADVHGAHAAGEWPRLKACANPDCQWVYYDSSRNRSGRWCSMNECGDVMKARAYRRRARQA